MSTAFKLLDFPYNSLLIMKQNKESLCDSLRARVGTQVHLQLHTGRIPAEHFFFIGKGISYKEIKPPWCGSSTEPRRLFLFRQMYDLKEEVDKPE